MIFWGGGDSGGMGECLGGWIGCNAPLNSFIQFSISRERHRNKYVTVPSREERLIYIVHALLIWYELHAVYKSNGKPSIMSHFTNSNSFLRRCSAEHVECYCVYFGFLRFGSNMSVKSALHLRFHDDCHYYNQRQTDIPFNFLSLTFKPGILEKCDTLFEAMNCIGFRQSRWQAVT